MKKLLLFLTFLSVSHFAYGAVNYTLEQAKENLWDVFANPHKATVQNMTPQKALDACKQEDSSFSFDAVCQLTSKEKKNTILHFACINNNLEQVKFIFEHITNETKSTLPFTKNQEQEIPLHHANKNILNYIIEEIKSPVTLFCFMHNILDYYMNKKNYDMAIFIMAHNKYICEYKTFNIFLITDISQQLITLIAKILEFNTLKTNLQDLILIIQNQKHKPDTLAKMLLTLLKAIYTKKQNLDVSSVEEYNDLIDAIVTNKNFNKDVTLYHLIHQKNIPAIAWLFSKFPTYQFTDKGYINFLTTSDITVIQCLINHGITNISPKHYQALKDKISTTNLPEINKLTINSWNRGRSLSLKTIGIATILYDFIKFKKPEKVTDDKKDSKKAAIKQDKKESKEKQKRSLLKRLAKHTRNYKKDLLTNPGNHKKLAIPVACLLLRLLKDKTPLKWY